MSITLNYQSCPFKHHHFSRIKINPSYLEIRASKERATDAISLQTADVKQRKLLHKASATSPGTLITENATDTKDLSVSTSLFVKEVLRRKEAEEEIAHSQISMFQRSAMVNVKPVLEESVRDLYSSVRPECVKLADLGRSCWGPNAAFYCPLSEIEEAVRRESRRLGERPPGIQAFLNYVPMNGTDNLFRSVSRFGVKTGEGEADSEPCFVAGVTGSFRGRLFPRNSIHFVHSSYAINWLSQVPKRLVSGDGRHMNKGNICVAKTSPISVQGAYSNQFESDFFDFLRARSEEITPGGRMVIAMMGSNGNKRGCYNIWELLGLTLNDMVSDGLVQESMLDSFNLPLHFPCREEVRLAIQKEGSFRLVRHETFTMNWDGESYYNMVNNVVGREEYENVRRGKRVSASLRADGGSVFADCFGDEIAEALFRRHSKKVAEYLDSVGEGMWTNHVVSVVKGTY